jgi:hypothetical protein
VPPIRCISRKGALPIQEQIRRNQERLKSLNLPSLASEVARQNRKADPQRETKGPKLPRQPKTPVIPSKRSLRSAGLDVEGAKFAAGLADDCNWDAVVSTAARTRASNVGDEDMHPLETYGA